MLRRGLAYIHIHSFSLGCSNTRICQLLLRSICVCQLDLPARLRLIHEVQDLTKSPDWRSQSPPRLAVRGDLPANSSLSRILRKGQEQRPCATQRVLPHSCGGREQRTGAAAANRPVLSSRGSHVESCERVCAIWTTRQEAVGGTTGGCGCGCSYTTVEEAHGACQVGYCFWPKPIDLWSQVSKRRAWPYISSRTIMMRFRQVIESKLGVPCVCHTDEAIAWVPIVADGARHATTNHVTGSNIQCSTVCRLTVIQTGSSPKPVCIPARNLSVPFTIIFVKDSTQTRPGPTRDIGSNAPRSWNASDWCPLVTKSNLPGLPSVAVLSWKGNSQSALGAEWPGICHDEGRVVGRSYGAWSYRSRRCACLASSGPA